MKGNKAYQRGSAFERWVKQRYEDLGFFVVKSAGSKGKADLVAIELGQTILIQCKFGKTEISKQERQQFTELVNSLEVTGIIAYGGTGRNYKEDLIIGELQNKEIEDDLPTMCGSGGHDPYEGESEHSESYDWLTREV